MDKLNARTYRHYYRVYLRALRWRSARFPRGRMHLAAYAHNLAHIAARSVNVAAMQRAYNYLVLTT